MGIGDRDYMRRRPDDADDRETRSAGGSKLATGLARFFERYPRFGLWLAVVLGVLILAALIVARLSMH